MGSLDLQPALNDGASCALENAKNIKHIQTSRRRFMERGVQSAAGMVALASGILVPGTAVCATRDWYGRSARPAPQAGSGPLIPKWPDAGEIRQIWLKRIDTGQTVVARYYDGQNLVRDDYLACCSVLRDVQSGTVAHIDIELLDLVFSMQKWLVEWGIDKPLLVLSGYRTVRTNTKELGALNSMHMEGRAMDFSIEGIPSEYMGRLASIFVKGGVGFYVGNHGFTHIDTGKVRFWAKRRD